LQASNTYLLINVERMNNTIKNSTNENALQYMAQAILRTFPIINLMPTTVN